MLCKCKHSQTCISSSQKLIKLSDIVQIILSEEILLASREGTVLDPYMGCVLLRRFFIAEKYVEWAIVVTNECAFCGQLREVAPLLAFGRYHMPTMQIECSCQHLGKQLSQMSVCCYPQHEWIFASCIILTPCSSSGGYLYLKNILLWSEAARWISSPFDLHNGFLVLWEPFLH